MKAEIVSIGNDSYNFIVDDSTYAVIDMYGVKVYYDRNSAIMYGESTEGTFEYAICIKDSTGKFYKRGSININFLNKTIRVIRISGSYIVIGLGYGGEKGMENILLNTNNNSVIKNYDGNLQFSCFLGGMFNIVITGEEFIYSGDVLDINITKVMLEPDNYIKTIYTFLIDYIDGTNMIRKIIVDKNNNIVSNYEFELNMVFNKPYVLGEYQGENLLDIRNKFTSHSYSSVINTKKLTHQVVKLKKYACGYGINYDDYTYDFIDEWLFYSHIKKMF